MSDWLSWSLRAWTSVVFVVAVASIADGSERRDPSIARPVPVERAPLVEPAKVDLPSPSTTVTPSRPVAAPVRVEAPAVGIAADLVAVGKTPEGALAVPDFGTAGWYEQSVRPGADGASVLAGHVDSTSGPDVFYSLKDLQPGDEIIVRRADGSSARFIVREVEMTDKDRLPIERVFGATPDPALRLITCGGSFDRSVRSYESNVIVYADPAPNSGVLASR